MIALALPIVAPLIASVDAASFHSIRPNDLGIHGRVNALDVTAIEEGIDSSEEFDVIRLALRVQVDVAEGCGKRARV